MHIPIISISISFIHTYDPQADYNYQARKTKSHFTPYHYLCKQVIPSPSIFSIHFHCYKCLCAIPFLPYPFHCVSIYSTFRPVRSGINNKEHCLPCPPSLGFSHTSTHLETSKVNLSRLLLSIRIQPARKNEIQLLRNSKAGTTILCHTRLKPNP